jgi:hypothetical protein
VDVNSVSIDMRVIFIFTLAHIQGRFSMRVNFTELKLVMKLDFSLTKVQLIGRKIRQSKSVVKLDITHPR